MPPEEKRLQQHRALGALLAAEHDARMACRAAAARLGDLTLRARAGELAHEHQVHCQELKPLVAEHALPRLDEAVPSIEASSDREILEALVSHDEAIRKQCRNAWPWLHGPQRIRAVSRCLSDAQQQKLWLERALSPA